MAILKRYTGSNWQIENLETTWSKVQDKPATFTPTSHSHLKSEVGLGNVDNTADTDKYVAGVKETRNSANLKFWSGTQAQYEAIGTKDANTIYFVEES